MLLVILPEIIKEIIGGLTQILPKSNIHEHASLDPLRCKIVPKWLARSVVWFVGLLVCWFVGVRSESYLEKL